MYLSSTTHIPRSHIDAVALARNSVPHLPPLGSHYSTVVVSSRTSRTKKASFCPVFSCDARLGYIVGGGERNLANATSDLVSDLIYIPEAHPLGLVRKLFWSWENLLLEHRLRDLGKV
jgi:hypothetical protein